ncbi:MAG: hypothetical protein ACREP9_03590, partial [Candidatus Dormibacteraceae bacterium]
AEGTRMSFDTLRAIFAYGVLCYEVFTLVNDQALFVLEQALRDRFVDYHQGIVRFVDRARIEHVVTAERYQQVNEIVKVKKNWLLVIDGKPPIKFNGMLADLRTWARQVGLLRGQRNRGIEGAMSNLRNFVAHPTNYHLVDPAQAARTLSDLSEIINHLWGCPTPGGRLYPAPIMRGVVVIAWSTDGDGVYITLADGLADAVDPGDREWQYAIVRAVFRPDDRLSDPGLTHFDSRVEATHFPADLLWGPGTLTDATAWWTAHRPEADKCDYLDRTFLVRQAGDQLYRPIRPSIAGMQHPDEQSGTWYAMKADFPEDAYHHVRTLLTGSSCAKTGQCLQCPVEMLGIGSYLDVSGLCTEANPAEVTLTDVRTPLAFPRSQIVASNSR